MAQPQIQFQPLSDERTGAKRSPVQAADDLAPAFASPARALQHSVAARMAAEPQPELWHGAARVAVIVGGASALWSIIIASAFWFF